MRALARSPELILVDELAHSNVPGSRHPKRWQDVEELLDAGIDVWTTINVQHLESLNDVVSGITGIRVRETVPDRVFDEADEVVLVDLPPDELLQRLKEGKVYIPQQAERAMRNFFRKGNLIALRELALRRTADRVDDEMLRLPARDVGRRRSGRRAKRCWSASARASGGREAGAQRRAHGGAARRALACRCTSRRRGCSACRRRAPAHRARAQAGAGAGRGDRDARRPTTPARRWSSTRASTTCRGCVVGRDHPRRAGGPGARSLAERIGAAAPDLDVIQVARGDDARAAAAPREPALRRRRRARLAGLCSRPRPSAAWPRCWPPLATRRPRPTS